MQVEPEDVRSRIHRKKTRPCRQRKRKRTEVDKDGVQQQKSVGLVSGVGLIVGTIIGSGIFVSPKGMLEGGGSVGLTLILWAACGLLSTMGALVYAELGAAIPKSGGEHAYLFYTFQRDRADIKGGPGRVPAFLFDWVALFIIRPTMFAVISLALGTYTVKPFYPSCEPPTVVVKMVTVAAMCSISFVNCASVRVATSVQNICTFAKILALIIVAIGGIVVLIGGDTSFFDVPFEDTVSSPSLAANAFYNGLWAYDGWNSLNFVTEELKDPAKNLPRAIIIGIPLTTVCYVLANVGYFAVLSKAEILQSYAVAVRWGELMLGPVSWLMPVFVVVSAFGAANGCLFASGRLSYTAGREGHFPQVLGFLHINRLTPVPAILFTTVIGILLVLPGDIGILINIFIFSSWLFYGWTTLSLLVLRYREPDLPRPYKVPIVIPFLILLACGWLIVTPVVQSPSGTGLSVLITMLLGIGVYVVVIHRENYLPGMDAFTSGVQKLLCIAPSRPN